jgi:integrase
MLPWRARLNVAEKALPLGAQVYGFGTLFLRYWQMASLHKDPRGNSPYWYVAYRTAAGKRALKSTKLKSHRKAVEFALNLERAEQEAAAGHLHEARVRELLNDTLIRTMGRSLSLETARSWFTKWLGEKTADGSLGENSRIAYGATIRIFLQHLAKRADEAMSQIRADDIQAFKQARIGEGLSAKTIDRDLKVIRTILKQARLHGHITDDPAQLVPLLSKRNKRNVQAVTRETFTVAELDALMGSASGEWLTTVTLARYTGARQGDCVRMSWSNIDLEGRLIRYSDAKTHKLYVVPLHVRLEKHLRSLDRPDSTDGLLCPKLSQKSSGGKYGLSMEFRRLMARAQVDDRTVETKSVRNVAGKVRHLARRSFHSIRHSYNSELANTGTSQEIRRKLVGHADDDVNDLYTHLDQAVFRQAMDRLS